MLAFVILFFAPAARAQQDAVKKNDHQMSSRRSKFDYPSAKKVEQYDDYHGTKVHDPYRWLENPAAPDSRRWIEAQNNLTFGFLNEIPQRAAIKARLEKLWNYEKYGVPFKRGDRYFLTKNDGLQNQSVLYSMRALDGGLELLLDPNKLSADGTVALSGYDISDDGKLLAYGLAASGSDWVEWRVRDVASGRDLDDHLKWSKFSGVSWTKDNKGFYYSRYDEPRAATKLEDANYYHKLYYHRVGTSQADDRLIYERRDQKEWGFGGEVTDDGRYLIINVWQGTDPKNRVFYQDLETPNAAVVELLPTADAAYNFLGNDGPVFYFRTDSDAPRGRVVAIDTRRSERANWRELVAQTADTLESASIAGDVLIASYLKDAHTRVKTFGLDGTPGREITFPELGTASGFYGRRREAETFYSFTNFTRPASIYRYDLRTGATTLFREPKLAFRPADYETKQVFYTSKDGTRVPMFITHKRA